MFHILNYLLVLVFLFMSFFPLSSDAMNRRKFKEQPPRISNIQYHWCQPLTERQLRQREKWGTSFNREVGKEEGKRVDGFRTGVWTFWDKQGKKMATGNCQANPPAPETRENGTWTYWDTENRKIEIDWQYGKFNGKWTLYDSEGKKRWQYQVREGQIKKELFADEAYLKAQNLRETIPAPKWEKEIKKAH